jgi:hypothetical protein
MIRRDVYPQCQSPTDQHHGHLHHGQPHDHGHDCGRQCVDGFAQDCGSEDTRTRSARVRGARIAWRGSGRAVGVTRTWRGGGLGPCVAAMPAQRPVAPLTCAQDVMIPRLAVAADAMASGVPQQANYPGRWRALDAKTGPVMALHGGARRRKRAQRLGATRPRASRQHAMVYPEPDGVSDGGMPAAQPRALRQFVRPTTPLARCHNTWRQRVARLGREAWSCSKTLAHHMGAITRCMCHDNLTRAAASRAHDMECTTGAMPNRVRIMPPVLKPVGWLDHDRRRRLSSNIAVNIAVKGNQVIHA